MSVFFKGYDFEHTELLIRFIFLIYVCAIVKEAKDANLFESGIKTNLQLNLCPSKSTNPVFKRILFQYLRVNLQPCFFRTHYKMVSL